MYENDTKSTSEHAPRAPTSATPEHAPRAPSSGDIGTQRTDPKYARESFTLRRMQPWQIALLAIAAAVVVALVVFYI